MTYLFKHLIEVGQLALDHLLRSYLILHHADLILQLVRVVRVGKDALALKAHSLMFLFHRIQLLD